MEFEGGVVWSVAIVVDGAVVNNADNKVDVEITDVEEMLE